MQTACGRLTRGGQDTQTVSPAGMGRASARLMAAAALPTYRATLGALTLAPGPLVAVLAVRSASRDRAGASGLAIGRCRGVILALCAGLGFWLQTHPGMFIAANHAGGVSPGPPLCRRDRNPDGSLLRTAHRKRLAGNPGPAVGQDGRLLDLSHSKPPAPPEQEISVPHRLEGSEGRGAVSGQDARIVARAPLGARRDTGSPVPRRIGDPSGAGREQVTPSWRGPRLPRPRPRSCGPCP